MPSPCRAIDPRIWLPAYTISFSKNQRYTTCLFEHGKFRKIAFSVDMFLFPNPFAECTLFPVCWKDLKFISR